MVAVLAYAWSAHILLLCLRSWAARGAPGRFLKALRLLGSVFPVLFPIVVGTAETPTAWSRLPEFLLSPWVAWPTVALWAMVIVRNAFLIARLASADRRLVTGAWRLDAVAADPLIGYAHLAYRLGLRKAPPLMGSRDIASPVVCGAAPPTILLPVSWIPLDLVDFPDDDIGPARVVRAREALQAALAHELAHVAQRDALRRLLDILGACFLPLELVSGRSFGSSKPPSVFLRVLHRLVQRECEAEEREADRLASRLSSSIGPMLDAMRTAAGVPPHPPPTPVSRVQMAGAHGLLLAALGCLLVASPSRADVGRAFGREVPIPHRLPEGWVINCPFPDRVAYGFLPRERHREASLHLQLGEDASCVLGHYTFVHRECLRSGIRLEFEMIFDLEEGALPPGTVAGFLLVPYDGRDRSLFQSWAQSHPAASVERLAGRRYRFRNGLDLAGVKVDQIRDLWIEAQFFGPVHVDLYPPRLWVIGKDGTRRPYATGTAAVPGS